MKKLRLKFIVTSNIQIHFDEQKTISLDVLFNYLNNLQNLSSTYFYR